MAIALAVVAVLAAIAVIWLALSRVSQQHRADTAERKLEGFAEKLDAISKATADEIARRESLINYLKAELKEADDALASNRDPRVVRERLRRVLTLQTPATDKSVNV